MLKKLKLKTILKKRIKKIRKIVFIVLVSKIFIPRIVPAKAAYSAALAVTILGMKNFEYSPNRSEYIIYNHACFDPCLELLLS